MNEESVAMILSQILMPWKNENYSFFDTGVRTGRTNSGPAPL